MLYPLNDLCTRGVNANRPEEAIEGQHQPCCNSKLDRPASAVHTWWLAEIFWTQRHASVVGGFMVFEFSKS